MPINCNALPEVRNASVNIRKRDFVRLPEDLYYYVEGVGVMIQSAGKYVRANILP